MQEPENEISLLHDPSTALKFQNQMRQFKNTQPIYVEDLDNPAQISNNLISNVKIEIPLKEPPPKKRIVKEELKKSNAQPVVQQ